MKNIKTLSIFALAFLSTASLSFAEESNTSSIENDAIVNSGTITDPITGIFTSNTAGNGAAIYNSGTISSIEADFTENAATTGGAIYNTATGTITSISGDFTKNTASSGTAIYNLGNIGSISGNFILNNDTGNWRTFGGAIYNSNTITSLSATFIANTSLADGGAIYNTGGSITITGGDYIGNVTGGAATAGGGGGAISNVNSGVIKIESTTGDIEFTGNKTSKNAYNGITNSADLYLNTYNDATITINDAIGYYENTGTIYVNYNENASAGTSYNTVKINDTIYGQEITVYNGTLELGSYAGTDTLYEDYYTNSNYDYASEGYASMSEYIEAVFGADVSTSSASAGLSLTSIIVNSGATLSITATTAVTISADSSITLKVGSTMVFAEDASLSLASGASVIIDMIDLSTESFIFAQFANSTDLATFLLEMGMIEDIENLESIGDGIISVVYGENGTEIDSEYYEYYLEGNNIGITVSGVPVPEPSTYAMILGLFALGFAYYRRRK